MNKSSAMKKLLSIIVPSYNMEAYLPKCLGSLIVDDKELLQKLDVIVVNDGSKDRTSEIAHKFESQYPGVFRVVDKANGHYGSCINAALKIAIGEFVKVLDADDYFCSEQFEHLLRCLDGLVKETTSIDVVFTDYTKVDFQDKILTRIKYPFDSENCFAIDEIAKIGGDVAMHALTYRTGLLRDINYAQTEGIPYTDTEWCFEPIAYVRKAKYLPAAVYMYRIGREDQTVSVSATRRNFKMYLTLLERMANSYDRCCQKVSPSAVTYLDSAIYRLGAMLYLICLTIIPFSMFCESFDRLDAVLKTRFPKTYEETGKIYVSQLFHWNYVKRLRGGGRLRLLYLLMIRTYSYMVKNVAVLKRAMAK